MTPPARADAASPRRRAVKIAASTAGYLALAVGITWPAALHPVAAVPGGPRTDAADSLWTLWFVARRLAEGRLPTRVDGLLDFPEGGAFWPADPLDGLVGFPLVLAFGPAVAWTVLSLLHLTLAGLGAHALARALGGNGWVAGALYVAAPITLSHLQNGASEAVLGTAVLPWAGLAAVRLCQAPSGGRALLTALSLAVAATSHAYTGVDAFLLVACLLVVGLPAMAPAARRWLGVAALLGALLAAGPAALALTQARAADNVVGIKTDKELSTIRRTIGPTEPEVYVRPGDFRSPDFRTLSRYGEALVHCAYLGFVPLLGALVSLRRRPRLGALWLAGGVALLLALGPVLVDAGGPVILSGRRAVPLPYLLVERLPGFASLSLLWRLAQLGSLALAVLCAHAVGGAGRSGVIAAVVVVAGLAETRLLSPAHDLPGHISGDVSPAILALRDAPDGAVMNFPVVGARGYLYEQTVHGKPVTGTLNFPNNNASRRVWKVAVENAATTPDVLVSAVSAAARAEGIRYLVLHTDGRAYDDSMYTDAVKALRAAMQPLAEADGVRVYALY